MELVNAMKRRRVPVPYLQETNLKEDKAEELTDDYKLCYIEKNNVKMNLSTRNKVERR